MTIFVTADTKKLSIKLQKIITVIDKKPIFDYREEGVCLDFIGSDENGIKELRWWWSEKMIGLLF